MAAGLLRTARSGSVVLSLYPLSQPRDERRAEQHLRSAPIRPRCRSCYPPAVRIGASALKSPLSHPLRSRATSAAPNARSAPISAAR